MSWRANQEALTQEARLLASSPEEVFRELKFYGERVKSDPYLASDEQLEEILFKRGEPLIDLCLANYGANKEVVAALYNRAVTATDNPLEMRYRKGLRIACLSNQSISSVHFLFSFPDGLIGPEETARIFAGAGSAKDKHPSEGYGAARALICNPMIDEDVLEALYEYKEPFSKLGQDCWELLVSISQDNKRLSTCEDNDAGPDMGHWRIQQSIFKLLGIAPVNMFWVRDLYALLDSLDFQHTAVPDRIDHVLSRWAELADHTSDGKLIEGDYTSLSMRDEFRCLIAAMYGRGFRDHRTIIFGSPSAADLALRCAYYGKGDLTIKDMKRGFKRDRDVYLFAVSLNTHVHDSEKQKKLLEDQLEFKLALTARYRGYSEQRRKHWLKGLSSEQKPQEKIEAMITGIDQKTAVLTKQLNRVRELVIVVIIIVALIAIFKT